MPINHTETSLDPTFRHFDRTQATSYATFRGGYSSSLYDTIARYHDEHCGVFGSILDVGCGTGSVTRAMALRFDNATGVDAGGGMITEAKTIGGHTKAGGRIAYEVMPAEELGSMPDGSVDLLTAGMAAHWFHMDRFWLGAAHAVSPGGTVAIWTRSSLYCHPKTPNAAEVQQALFDLEQNILGPFELPANKLSRNMYDNLPLPWEINPPVAAFSPGCFVRLEWNRDGSLDGQSNFFAGGSELTLRELGESLGTASMVVRWREANPRLSGTDQDCVKVTINRIAKEIGAETVESDNERVRIRVSSSTALLLFTKRRES